MNAVVLGNTWTEDSLFAKAKVYIEQMEKSVAGDWQYGLWSALCLELLARSALAHISPVLLADAKYWQNLIHALGMAPTAKRFTPMSISSKEVFDRLSELLPDFTGELVGFCSQHIKRRNAELHSGETSFIGISTAAWLPKFYKASKILLESMDRDIADFVRDPDNVNNMIDSLEDAAAKSVKQDINSYARVWLNKDDDERKKATMQALTWANRHSGHRVTCPACESPALIHGTVNGPVATEVGDDEVTQRQTMLPSSFECIACGLKITGFSKLAACDLGDTFTEKSTYTAAEFFNLYTDEDVEEARAEFPEFEPDFND